MVKLSYVIEPEQCKLLFILLSKVTILNINNSICFFIPYWFDHVIVYV